MNPSAGQRTKLGMTKMCLETEFSFPGSSGF